MCLLVWGGGGVMSLGWGLCLVWDFSVFGLVGG